MDINILDLIKPEYIILIVVAYCLGMFLKLLPKVNDWLIPFVILGVTSVIATLYIAVSLDAGFTYKVLLDGVINGLLCSAIAVFGNQAIKQAIFKRGSKDKEV